MAISNWDLDALTRDPGLVAITMRTTSAIAAVVRSNAPEDSGDYKGGIRTRLKYQERVVGVVEATDEKSLIVEAKTGVMARSVKRSARKR